MTHIKPAIKPTTRYLGSVAAAAKLGVSRSTIHHAVTMGALLPDMRTPRGHARFSAETIESFRLLLASRMPREATRELSGETVYQHIRLLGTMVRLLTSKGEVEEVCQAALGIIEQLVPHVHMGHVALARPGDNDPRSVRVVAHHGYPADTITTYRELGRSAGPFTTDEVVKAGQARWIEMPAQPEHSVLPGTALFLKHLDAHTFLALPLLVGGQSIGALVVVSQREHAWDAADVELLRAVADHLAATVAAAHLIAKQRRMLSGGRELVTLALSLRGTMPAEDAPRQLAEAYCAASGAVGVCVVGMGPDLLIGEPWLREHALRARADGVPKLDILDSETPIQTVVASALSLPSGERAGLAAIWPGRRSDLEAQHKLLTVFGGACVLVLSPSNA